MGAEKNKEDYVFPNRVDAYIGNGIYKENYSNDDKVQALKAAIFGLSQRFDDIEGEEYDELVMLDNGNQMSKENFIKQRLLDIANQLSILSNNHSQNIEATYQQALIDRNDLYQDMEARKEFDLDENNTDFSL